ncbi:MAG TPA: UDP-2,3-diacylglucosamine diphosphatase [Gammaproteobacteria bacterium]|nr:UDP-2,3-diacylglucosamine diphosphatase [Gammaproteobacteria bacterium]
MTALFISDLHLTAGDAETTRRFVEFMAGPARAARDLYILGDLFEAWIGDDDDDPRLAPIVAALRELTDAGVSCALMHGNRDFLLGPRFCAATGARLLGDYERIVLFGQPVLLTHGDLLCTDDTRYMALRSELRSPNWQRDFLARPLDERRQIASDLRQLSATEIAAKDEYIMDVNQAAVERTMRDHDVTLLMHGHTHRPAVHRFELGGRPAARIVLGAWYHDPSIVRWTDSGFELEALR